MMQLVPCFGCNGFFPPGHAACPNCGAKKSRGFVRTRLGPLAGAGTALFSFVACNCYGLSVCPPGTTSSFPRACYVYVPYDAGPERDAGQDAGPPDAGPDGGEDAGADAGDGG